MNNLQRQMTVHQRNHYHQQRAKRRCGRHRCQQDHPEVRTQRNKLQNRQVPQNQKYQSRLLAKRKVHQRRKQPRKNHHKGKLMNELSIQQWQSLQIQVKKITKGSQVLSKKKKKQTSNNGALQTKEQKKNNGAKKQPRWIVIWVRKWTHYNSQYPEVRTVKYNCTKTVWSPTKWLQWHWQLERMKLTLRNKRLIGTNRDKITEGMFHNHFSFPRIMAAADNGKFQKLLFPIKSG